MILVQYLIKKFVKLSEYRSQYFQQIKSLNGYQTQSLVSNANHILERIILNEKCLYMCQLTDPYALLYKLNGMHILIQEEY